MPRKPRQDFAGALFHVYDRGNARQRIFLEDSDWIHFLNRLARLKKEFAFRLYAYCLMPNHFHLLIQIAEPGLSRAMHRLLTGYSWYFNTRYERVGHVFQGRFGSILCERDSYLLALIRYIHLNPVRAGLVSDPADWRWSGHRELCGLVHPFLIDGEFPLSLFADEPMEARLSYQEFVRSRRRMGHIEAFYPPNGILGSMKIPRATPKGSKRSLLEICGAERQAVVAGTDRSQAIVAARHRFIIEASDDGYGPTEIAIFLGCGQPCVSKVIRAVRNVRNA